MSFFAFFMPLEVIVLSSYQFFNRDLIYFVQDVYAGDVDSVALDDVYKVFDGGVVLEHDVGVADPVLVQHCLHHVQVQLALRNQGLQVDPALFLLFK